jgi:nucleotide-binding universal stress UspA family protein
MRVQRVINGDALAGKISRVLVPVDLSASSAEVLYYARMFAKPFHAIVELLHVVQLNIVGEERGVPRLGLIRELSDNARRELHRLVEKLWEDDIVGAIAVREGRPHEIIVQEARDTNAGMIVMGSRRLLSVILRIRRISFADSLVHRLFLVGVGCRCHSRTNQ